MVAKLIRRPVTVAFLRVTKTLVDDHPGELHIDVWVHATSIPFAGLDRIGDVAGRSGR